MQKTTDIQRFWFLWILLSFWFGHFKTISLPPQGMHQGAQSDRACVAMNYYSVSMNFFQPRVSEIRGADGVAGMEFPAIPYTVALLYKIFGPHEFIYRLLMYLIVSFGVFSAWRITGFFIQRELHRLFVTFGWYSSPVLAFYTPNFLPDPAALSFSMAALFYIFRRIYQIQSGTSYRNYLLFITLAGLIKVSFLITHVAVFLLLITWKWLGRDQQVQPELKKAEYWGFLLPLLPIGAWYYYSSQLTAKTWNTHFLQQINPARSVGEFWENTRYAFSTWGDSLYAPGFLWGILVLLLITAYFRYKNNYLPAVLSVLLLGGFAAAFVLFSKQYRFHDYYFILLMPSILFAYIFLQQVWLENRSIFIGMLPVLVLVAFWYFSVKNMFHTDDMLELRYTAGNYYNQNAFDGAAALPLYKGEIDKLVPAGAPFAFAFDPTPNTALYQLRRRGIRISRDFEPKMAASILHDNKTQYLLLNDSVAWAQNFSPHLNKKTTLLWHKQGLWLYGVQDGK